MTTMVRALICLLIVAVLASCGRSHVVREGGARGPVRVSTPKYGSTVVVQRGQTLYRIATNNGISPLDLAVWNSVPPPYTIYPGQRLRLYPSTSRAPLPNPSRPISRPPTSTTPRPPPEAPVVAPVSSPVPWRWPTEGQLIGRYVSGEPTKQGIDIAGTGGQAVRAAGDGVVVYSGSGLVGYGELIIVKHNEQWLSAYGHNRSRLVNEGQIVKSGQQIAEMGRSGAARDMLHFEIRYNGKPVDPLAYLPKK
ncbi:peptidoglycan DD-metalloendopeptidase family protein [Luteimonas galliterrae]|nr:peptidoglycan DD-metalloendopeptidase family protein [Luteimonas galliterrae]